MKTEVYVYHAYKSYYFSHPTIIQNIHYILEFKNYILEYIAILINLYYNVEYNNYIQEHRKIERTINMNQIVQIDLVTTTTTAYDNFLEIKKALENASLRLYSNYNVQIKDIQTVGKQVIMNVTIPDDIAPTFRIGYHLRGVSAYLIKNYKNKFSPLIVAKRLLIYTVIPNQNYNDETGLTLNERLTAISNFSELLKNTDAVSISKITRILEILRED